MNRHHQKTLEALFSHPLQHGVRAAKVEALFRQLGAEVTKLSDSRLRIRLAQTIPTGTQPPCGGTKAIG